MAKAAEEFINIAMPVVIDLWGENGYCSNSGNSETWTSIYLRQLCVIPCMTQLRPYQQISLVECGESVACCEQRTLWCKNDDNTFTQTIQEPKQIGKCSPGTPEETCFKWEGAWDECKPRDCIRFN